MFRFLNYTVQVFYEVYFDYFKKLSNQNVASSKNILFEAPNPIWSF